MTRAQVYLILIILFSLLFIALMTAGSYLYSIRDKQLALAMFLFAFGAVIGQITSLALFIRLKALQQARLQMQQQKSHTEQQE
ncbi:NGO_0222 family membrane protein [Conchiformibius kuhniae]|uniref:NGO_0222 family membrane protein n=1 Tax=Conchiformibius kuhniae TaxID=211502 RepID=A0A8T9MXA0_9NEIS|nr:NGO_0222 family membrane protein [Conchiformibius kuhniae]UOP05046.1 hypothetical protein LVJ77_01685 [Conchiformibius kuhniae]